MTNDILDSKDVAARLRICRASVYKLAAVGLLHPLPGLRRLRFCERELNRYETARQPRSSSQTRSALRALEVAA